MTLTEQYQHLFAEHLHSKCHYEKKRLASKIARVKKQIDKLKPKKCLS